VHVRTNCIRVANNAFGEPVGRHALLIEDGASNSFINNRCEQAEAEYVKIIGTHAVYPVHATTISNNYLTQLNNPEKNGIYLKNAKGVTITGNWFAGGFPQTGASAVVFDGGVSEVFMAGNVNAGLEPEMPGSEAVPLLIDDFSATQSSQEGAFSTSLTVGEAVKLKPTLAPDSPVEGTIYMDATTHKLMVYDGTSWKACW
jgi:hypothetical protein